MVGENMRKGKKQLMLEALHNTNFNKPTIKASISLCDMYARRSGEAGRCCGLDCGDCDRMWHSIIKLGVKTFKEGQRSKQGKQFFLTQTYTNSI
jgi:hypothetical protein